MNPKVRISLINWAEIKNSILMPNLGLAFDNFQKDFEYDLIQYETGGTILNASLGLDFYFKRLYINSFLQLPLYERLPEEQASGSLFSGLGISYFLN